jgi:hypothetical protein
VVQNNSACPTVHVQQCMSNSACPTVHVLPAKQLTEGVGQLHSGLAQLCNQLLRALPCPIAVHGLHIQVLQAKAQARHPKVGVAADDGVCGCVQRLQREGGE